MWCWVTRSIGWLPGLIRTWEAIEQNLPIEA
jgi:hypothetical protein